MIIFALLALLGMQADKAPDPAPAPLEPAAPWVAEFEDSYCVISREFGVKGQGPVFGIKSLLPQNSSVDILLFTHGLDREQVETVTVADAADAGKAVSGQVLAIPVKDKQMTARIMTTDRDALMAIADGRPLRITYGKQMLLIRPEKFKGAANVLHDCEVNLAQHWNLDPEIPKKIATQPKRVGDGIWLMTDDYPTEALANGHQGAVMIAWDVTLDGHAANCRILSSSGHPELDRAACAAIEKRARYSSPALDKDGKPMLSYETRRVIWSLPR